MTEALAAGASEWDAVSAALALARAAAQGTVTFTDAGVPPTPPSDIAPPNSGSCLDSSVITLYKALQPGYDGQSLESSGFPATQFPGEGAFFFENPQDAAATGNNYQNGIMQVTISQTAWNALQAAGVVVPDTRTAGSSLGAWPQALLGGLPSFNASSTPGFYAPGTSALYFKFGVR